MNRFLSLIAFSHTVFALPFAMIMVLILHKTYSITAAQLSLIIIALVTARTAAMGFNRIVDRAIDAKNPRTADREIPSGRVTLSAAVTLTAVSTIAFLCAAAALGTHCLIAAPLVLIVLFGYSLSKRFTAYAHLILGLALALAPGGVWYAITGKLSVIPLPLMAAVLFWVAGFDVLYALQDRAFDKSAGLYSIPVRFGVSRAKWIAFILHLCASVALTSFFVEVGAGWWSFCGVTVFTITLLTQHLLIRICGEQIINQLFFMANGAASLLLLFAVLLD